MAQSPTPSPPRARSRQHGASNPSPPPPPSRTRILAPSPRPTVRLSPPRAHPICALSAAAPAPAQGKVLGLPGAVTGDTLPTWEETASRSSSSRPGEASPTWQGTVSKFPSASPRERHPGSSQQEPTSAPPRVCSDLSLGYHMQRLRLRHGNPIAIRNHLQITISNAPDCWSLAAVCSSNH